MKARFTRFIIATALVFGLVGTGTAFTAGTVGEQAANNPDSKLINLESAYAGAWPSKIP